MPADAPWQDTRQVNKHDWWVAWHPCRIAYHLVLLFSQNLLSRGRFDPAKADALGVPAGPQRGILAKGEAIVVDGRTIEPHEVCGPPRQPRVVALVGDTNDSSSIYKHLRGADLISA